MKIFTILALTLLVISSLTIVAATSQEKYNFWIGNNVPNGTAAMALERGSSDILVMSGQGWFDKKSKEASGSGTFVHKDAFNHILTQGTWSATKLVSFTSYNGGGKALIKVHFVSSDGRHAEGVLKVIDPSGSRAPKQAQEGINLNLRELKYSFQTVFGGNVKIAKA